MKVLLPPGASPWLPITREAAQPSQNGGGPVVGVPDVHLETQSIQQRALSCQDDLLKVGEEFHILHVFQRFRVALVPAQGSQILLNFLPIRRYKPHSITLAAADVTKMSAWQPMRQICSSDNSGAQDRRKLQHRSARKGGASIEKLCWSLFLAKASVVQEEVQTWPSFGQAKAVQTADISQQVGA